MVRMSSTAVLHTISSLLFGFALVTVQGQTSRLTYCDLVSLNASCAPLDTCKYPRETESLFRVRCQCKLSCVKFDTCCVDAAARSPIRTATHIRRKGTCTVVIPNSVSVFVIKKCDARWRGNAMMKTMCESPEKGFRDPLSITPATSLQSEQTYQNYFCAVCNDDIDSLQFWDVKLGYFDPYYMEELLEGKNQSSASDYLKFNDTSDKWEIQIEQADGNKSAEMDINFSLPPHLADVVTPCVPELVSECHHSWKDENVRRKCSSYMAFVYLKRDLDNSSGVVYADPIVYRNIHCAICNYENYSEDTICLSYKYFRPNINPSMSFTILLDVNLNYGKHVGMVDLCKPGQIYDKFFKKCRNLVCGLPGYTMKNGKCHPPS